MAKTGMILSLLFIHLFMFLYIYFFYSFIFIYAYFSIYSFFWGGRGILYFWKSGANYEILAFMNLFSIEEGGQGQWTTVENSKNNYWIFIKYFWNC